jgi:hypothetical protein
MKPSFIAASLLVAGAMTAAASDTSRASRVEVSIELTSTSLHAQNRSDAEQVLLFRSRQGGRVLARTLPPGAELAYAFPRHALAGVELEVLTLRGSDMANSGVVRLDEVLAAGGETIWIQDASRGSRTWIEAGGEFALYAPYGTLLPPALFGARHLSLDRHESPEPGAQIKASTHVPVVTPSDKPDDYGPPVLEEEPLPPV